MRLITIFKSLFFLVVVGIVVGFLAVVFLGFENEALVKEPKELSTENIKRARQFIKEHNPDKIKAGRTKGLSVKEEDLNLVFHYLISRIPGGKHVGTQVNIEPGSAVFSSTLSLPKNPFRSYMNVSFSLLPDAQGPPTIKTFKIGRITFNEMFARPLVAAVLHGFGTIEGYQDIAQAMTVVKGCQFKKDQLLLLYEWQPELVEKIKEKGRNMLVPEKERSRLLVYNDHLAMFTDTVSDRKVSLSVFMEPVFKLAQERSDMTREPVLENRAAITVLALFALNKPLSLLVGEEEGTIVSTFGSTRPTLRGRPDLAKHFILSAAIAASADSSLADAIGLYKELDDSKGGSGFSFADLAADRAGVRFAVFGTANAQQAVRLQQMMSALSGEADFMPSIENLPENIQEIAFKTRYIDLESKAYAEVKDELERRIAACRLYQK